MKQGDLTSSMQSECCSLLAISRAVSPFEFTTGSRKDSFDSLHYVTQKHNHQSRMYLYSGPPLLWVAAWEIQVYGTRRCSEEPCFPLLCACPNSCCSKNIWPTQPELNFVRREQTVLTHTELLLNPVTRLTCSGKGNPPAPESFSPPDARQDGEPSP